MIERVKLFLEVIRYKIRAFVVVAKYTLERAELKLSHAGSVK